MSSFVADVIEGRATFEALVGAVGALRPRAEIVLAEAPAPRRLAPHALAVTAEVGDDENPIGDGRLVLLHDPAGREGWQGHWRVVVFATAELESEMAADPVLVDVGWTWLEESLGEKDLTVAAFGGTVTRTNARSFGTLAERDDEGQLEVRASWTALVEMDNPSRTHRGDVEILLAHVRAWIDLMATMAGLAPQQEGVAHLQRRPG